MRLHPIFSVLTFVWLLASCGGGGSEEQTEVLPVGFVAEESSKLTGDWPESIYVIWDQDNWERAWLQRRASLDCQRWYNAPACQSASPPSVDFRKYIVVGIHLGRDLNFTSTDKPIRATLEADRLLVEYQFGANLSTTPLAYPPSAAFWLLQVRPAEVTVRPASAA